MNGRIFLQISFQREVNGYLQHINNLVFFLSSKQDILEQNRKPGAYEKLLQMLYLMAR